MAVVSDSEVKKPVVITTPSDDGYSAFYQTLDEAQFDPSYWAPILGSGITGIIDHLLNQAETPLSQRWSDAKVDPAQLVGTALQALSENEAALSALSTRLENFSPPDLKPQKLSTTELRYVDGTTSFAIKGSNFNGDLFTALESAIDGSPITDVTLGKMKGQVGQLILKDTGTDPDVFMSIELKSTSGDVYQAEQISFDISGFRFQIDGSFPRDVATIYNWSQSGFGLGALIEQESARVDGIRLIMPEGEVIHIATDGITLTIPYDSDINPASSGETYALQFKLLGNFTNLGMLDSESDSWIDNDLDTTYLTEFSFSDVLLRESDWRVLSTQDNIALTLSETEWKFSVDELSFIVEGTMGNTFAAIDAITNITENTVGAGGTTAQLAEVIDRVRFTTDILDATDDNLVLLEYETEPYYLSGERLETGEEVEDFSNLSSGVTELVYNNAVGTDHDDVLFTNYGGSILIGGAGDDNLGQIYPWQDTWIVDGGRGRQILEGGLGADNFHIPISQWMYPIEIEDFDPSSGDQIVLNPSYSIYEQISGYNYDPGKGELTVNFHDTWADSLKITLPNNLEESDVLGRVVIDDQLLNLGIVDDLSSGWSNPVQTNAKTVFGTRWDDYITGGNADQNFIPFAGSAWIDGGDGVDTVTLTSRFDDFVSVLMRDASTKPLFEGIYSLTNVEQVAFRDGLYSLDDEGNFSLLESYKYLNKIDAIEGGLVEGTSGSDRIEALVNAVQIVAGDDDDLLLDSTSADLLSGETGYDRIESNSGADWVLGGEGNDEIVLTADSYWDSSALAVNGTIANLAGRFVYSREIDGLGRFEKVVDGGTDFDTIILGDESEALFLHDALSDFYNSAELALQEDYVGRDSVARISSIETIYAGAGHDLIDLTSSDYNYLTGLTVYGEAGNDTIWASKQVDILYGGDGDDIIFGDAGNDTLIGGLGADRFEFAAGSGSDLIQDFEVGTDTLVFYARNKVGFGSAGDESAARLKNGYVSWEDVVVDLNDRLLNDINSIDIEFYWM